MDIRLLQPEDAAPVMGLVAEFAEESLSDYGIYVDSDKLQKAFDATYKTSFAVIVDGKIVGVLCGQLITDICSDLLVYEEIVWYVNKKHRKYGLSLMKYVEEWCRVTNIKRIMMSCMHNSKTEKLFTLYKRLGFRPQETKFVKELD